MLLPKLADKRQKKGKLSYGLTVAVSSFGWRFLSIDQGTPYCKSMSNSFYISSLHPLFYLVVYIITRRGVHKFAHPFV